MLHVQTESKHQEAKCRLNLHLRTPTTRRNDKQRFIAVKIYVNQIHHRDWLVYNFIFEQINAGSESSITSLIRVARPLTSCLLDPEILNYCKGYLSKVQVATNKKRWKNK